MQATPIEIISPQFLTSSVITYYTSPPRKRTIISKVTFLNQASSIATFDLFLVPEGESATTSNKIMNDFQLGANESFSAYQLEGLVMEPGSKLAISADATGSNSITVAASGLQVF